MAGPLLRALAGTVLAGLGPACVACPAEAQRLVLCPDFSTPEAAGTSFWAAIACGEDVAAYKCLSEGLKRAHGATLDAFLLYKAELAADYGAAFRHAYRLRPVGEPQVFGERYRLWWGLDERPLLALEFEAQYYLDLYPRSDPARPDGDFLDRPPSALLRWQGSQLTLDLPADWRERIPDPSALARLTLGTEWKLRDVLAPPSP